MNIFGAAQFVVPFDIAANHAGLVKLLLEPVDYVRPIFFDESRDPSRTK
jgi:hypothetical protein